MSVLYLPVCWLHNRKLSGNPFYRLRERDGRYLILVQVFLYLGLILQALQINEKFLLDLLVFQML